MERQREEKFTLKELVKSIGNREETEWSKTKLTISENIYASLVKKLDEFNEYDTDKEDADKICNSRFIEYCSAIKALLTIYNFGTRSDRDEEKTREKNKQLILGGMNKILSHVADRDNYGFDISPSLENSEYRDIFGNENENPVPITSTAALVLTTLVYFRRAVKRRTLVTEEEWNRDWHERVTLQVADILVMFYKFVYSETKDESEKRNNFRGWGLTLDKNFTREINLSDTYLVIESISRFADACLQTDEEKVDKEFVNRIDKWGKERADITNLSARSEEATFKIASNIYDSVRDAKVFGKSIFYVSSENNKSMQKVYIPTSYEQIASSNRSSALFNPLYVAMITMYGYTDKEVVIARLQDDYVLANKLYEKYYENFNKESEDDVSLYDYSKTLKEKDSKKFYYGNSETGDSQYSESDFEKEVEILKKPHKKISKNASMDIRIRNVAENDSENISWRQYYNVARLFQKYIEKYHPEELLNIQEYKDYLNSTKDAIDQVQVMYRDFDSSQRLGIVDTDYAMYSQADILSDNGIAAISRLNKANIAVCNLRPLLLSSKIMIVNALTKYPAFDMIQLYDAIIDSQYKTRAGELWLWNADGINMKSTASHCDSLMYDYFDYYEKYELGLKAITSLRKNINGFIGRKNEIGDDLTIKFDRSNEAAVAPFVKLVLEMTRANIDNIRGYYRNLVSERDSEIVRLKESNSNLEKQVQSARDDERKKYEDIIEHRRETYDVGATLRKWIESGVENYMKGVLSMIVLKSFNRNDIKSGDSDKLKDLLEKGALLPDIKMVQEYWDKLKVDVDSQLTEEKKDERIKYYNDKIEENFVEFREGLVMSTDGVLEKMYTEDKFKEIKSTGSEEERAKKAHAIYRQNKEKQ